MIKKVVKKFDLKDSKKMKGDLEYWLKQPQQDRVKAVDYLRFQFYGRSIRLQRTARVIQRKSS